MIPIKIAKIVTLIQMSFNSPKKHLSDLIMFNMCPVYDKYTKQTIGHGLVLGFFI